MKKKGLLGMVLLASTGIAAAQATWTDTAETSEYKFSVKNGSFAVGKDKSGEAVAIVTAQSEQKFTKTIKVEKWYVRVSDCKKEEGKLITTDLSGKYLYDNDFVFGAGNVASKHAETICSVYDYSKSQNATKSM